MLSMLVQQHKYQENFEQNENEKEKDEKNKNEDSEKLTYNSSMKDIILNSEDWKEIENSCRENGLKENTDLLNKYKSQFM